jgi:hypothetical protein
VGIKRRMHVVDGAGVEGKLRGIEAEPTGHPIAVVDLANHVRVRVPFELLHHDAAGGYTLAARWSDFTLVGEGGASIPVIAQQVTVDVRPAPEKTLRARRRVVREQRVVEVPVWQERIDIERIPVNQFVEQAPVPHYEGDTLVIPCVEEVPIVEVRLRIREELRVRVVREQHVHRETVTLQRHEVDIDTSAPTPTTTKHEGD